MRSIKYMMATLSAVVLAGTAMAQTTTYSARIVYYSDASKTVIVGREYDLCDGDSVVYGTQTDYYDVYSGACP